MNSLFAKEPAVSARPSKDVSEFTAIYENYKNRIFRYIRFRVARVEEAEDLTSQTFLNAIDFFVRHQDKTKNTVAWLYKIAGNLVRDWYRKKKPLLLDEINEHPGFVNTHNLDQEIDKGLEEKKLLFFLNQLKEKEQQVIILKIFDELSFKEIADILNKKESAIKMLYYRALNKLRNLIKTEKYEQNSIPKK